MKPLHGFTQDRKWVEDLGHIGLGILPIDLLLWIREWTDWKLPWPFKGQWPPGDPVWYGTDLNPRTGLNTAGEEFAPLDRVADMGRDTLGYDIGRTIRLGILLGLLIWRG